MDRNVKTFLIVAVLVLAVAGGLIFAVSKSNKSDTAAGGDDLSDIAGEVAGVSTQTEKLDSSYVEKLAKFMADKGMVMYGAYTCSHCTSQKQKFGEAFKYIDYVECDAGGSSANPDECTAQDITGYPTWIYQGQKYPGEKSLSQLAQIVGFSE